MGRWMPQPIERYNDIFNLEYYWSPLLEVYESEYYGSYGWQNIRERRVNSDEDSLGEVYICSESHISEGVKNRDLSYNISAPAQLLVDSLGLKNDKFSGSRVDKHDELVMFDASFYGNESGNNLMVKKDALEELQKSTGCRVIWTILSEKIAMYGGTKSTEKRLNISGVYYLEDGELVGEDFFFTT